MQSSQNHTLNKVLPKFPPDAILILDNASNQNNNDVHEVMMDSFGGAYRFVPKYSPELKPIERAFSMVRTVIRDHENDTKFSDIELINYAFHLYSWEGERGTYCYQLFEGYRNNHNLWLQEQ